MFSALHPLFVAFGSLCGTQMPAMYVLYAYDMQVSITALRLHIRTRDSQDVAYMELAKLHLRSRGRSRSGIFVVSELTTGKRLIVFRTPSLDLVVAYCLPFKIMELHHGAINFTRCNTESNMLASFIGADNAPDSFFMTLGGAERITGQRLGRRCRGTFSSPLFPGGAMTAYTWREHL